jgi:homoserine kinase
MKVRVPASSANLGPGFDALAVALSLYIEVGIEPADQLSLTTSGFGSELSDPDNHLAVSLVRQIMGHDRVALSVHSEIPLARGLGSSAALAVAVAAAAKHHAPLEIGIAVDGHAENAAASLYGGLVTASVDDGNVFVQQLALDDALRFVIVIPERELATADARAVLPASVSYHDAAFNLSRVAALTAGLADHRQLVATAMDDRLHQPYRMSLLPFAHDLLIGMREAGALASCWSGAGSTMLGVTTLESGPTVAAAAQAVLNQHGEPGEVRIVEADRRGVTTIS